MSGCFNSDKNNKYDCQCHTEYFGCNKCKCEAFKSDDVKELQERVEKLEKHKNYQIDENRKISRRVDDLELLVNCIPILKKEPHKCPVCCGMTEVLHYFQGQLVPTKLQCKSCKGEGVLWR